MAASSKSTSTKKPAKNVPMLNGKIVLEIKRGFDNGLLDVERDSDGNEMIGDDCCYEICVNQDRSAEIERIKSRTIRVRNLKWSIRGVILEEEAVRIENDDFTNCKVFTLRLNLDCEGIPDNCECDVSGRLSIGTKLKGENLKTFPFARTFSPSKDDDYFLTKNNIAEIDVFEQLKIISNKDRIVVVAEFTVEPLREIRKWSKNDYIKINGQQVKVNKYLLALHSKYFSEFFFDHGDKFPQTGDNIMLPEATTVDDFKQMLDVLDGKEKLNYECIEGVFTLANFFGLEELEANCRKYLIEKSKKSAIFKYRIADTYGLILLRDVILENMTQADLIRNRFLDDPDYKKLEENGKAAIQARKAELYEGIEEGPESSDSGSNGSGGDEEMEENE